MTSSTLQQAIGTQAPVHEYKDLQGVSQRLAEQAHINLGHEAEVRRAHLDIATLKLEFERFKSAQPSHAPAQSNDQKPPQIDGLSEALAMMAAEINTLKIDASAKDRRIAALEQTLLQISSEITKAA